MRLALVALAACYTGTPAADPPRAAAATVVTIALHAPPQGVVGLIAAGGLSDGGLILVANAYPACGEKERQIEIVRFDAAGRARWTRCVPETMWGQAVAAASDDGVWIAQTVDPSAAEHVHGLDRELVVARHVTGDGVVGAPRAVVVWHDSALAPDASLAASSARNSVENLRLSAAAAAGGELIIAGATKAGAIVDGAWQTEVSGISMQGVVLAVPLAGPVRAVAASGGALFQDVAVAGDRYVATAWCSHSTEPRAPELFACPNSLTAFAITGSLQRAPAVAPQVHVLGQEIYDARAAIDGDGTIAVAASAWRSPVGIDQVTVASSCARFAFAASWTRSGTLRFARALGDCTQPHASPYATDGQASSQADDNISEHLADVANVAFIDHAAVITIRVEETNHLDWPLHIGRLALPAPFGEAGAALVLDERGELVRDHVLRVDGRPAEPDQPDGSLAPGAGVGRVVVTKAGARGWLVVEHGGSIAIDRRRFPLGSHFATLDPDLGHRRDQLKCDPAALSARPDIAEMVHSIRDGIGEPEDFLCRRHVVVEDGIDSVPF